MRISDWSSDVCSSDLMAPARIEAAVGFGHLLFVLPYVFLTLSEAYRRLDPRWSHVAHALGASANAVFWRVRLPLLLGPILTAEIGRASCRERVCQYV